jgi:hypothetical protein
MRANPRTKETDTMTNRNFDDRLNEALQRGEEAQAAKRRRASIPRVTLTSLVRADFDAHPDTDYMSALRRILLAMNLTLPTSVSDPELDDLADAIRRIHETWNRVRRELTKANA